MKFFSLKVFLLALFVAPAAVAQSRLPDCSTDPKVLWTNCQGTVTSADGSKYIGEFRNNRPSGQGTLTWTDGTKYVGQFDLPPLKWSSLMYVFNGGGCGHGKEEAYG